MRKVGGGALAFAAPLAVIYGVGFLRGNHVSEAPTVDIRLQQIIKPKAVSIAGRVLKINMDENNNIVVTKPDPSGDSPGEETVSLSSIKNNQWITIDASMYRNEQGQLDPTTVNDVDISQYDCDPPGTKNGICGGTQNNKEKIELLFGDEHTYTRGNWGLEDSLSPPGYDDPTLTINTATKSPTEDSSKADALHALKEATVFSRIAELRTEDALNGQIEVPHLKKAAVKHAKTA